MHTKNQPKSYSDARFYTFQEGDDKIGQELMSDGFISHANLTQRNERRWDFNPKEALLVQNDPAFV